MKYDSIHTEELHQILNAGGTITHNNKDTTLTFDGYTTRILFQQGRYFLLDTVEGIYLMDRFYQRKGLDHIRMDGMVILSQ